MCVEGGICGGMCMVCVCYVVCVCVYGWELCDICVFVLCVCVVRGVWYMCLCCVCGVCVCVIGQVCGICVFVLCVWGGVCACVWSAVPFLCRGHGIMKDPNVFLTFGWRSHCPPETFIFRKMYHAVE